MRIKSFDFKKLLVLLFLCISIYFTCYTDGHAQEKRYKDEFALDDGFYNNAYIGAWAARKTTQILSLKFVNAERILNLARRTFTEKGYRNFIEDLEYSGLLKMIEDFQMVISVTQNAKESLEEEWVENGVKHWLFSVPVKYTYQTANSTYREDKNVLLIVVRSNKPMHDMVAIDYISINDPEIDPEE